MKPTTEILDKIRENSRNNKEEIFTRLYRYMLRPDLYYLAYKNLYANKGAGTKGVNDDTADGFSEEKINRKRTLNHSVELCVPFTDKIMPFLFNKKIIQQLKDGTIEPIARKYIYRCTDLEIVSVYNSELRGICNYYALASNYNKLQYFEYLMEYSCLKTKLSPLSRQIFKNINDSRFMGLKFLNRNGA